MLVTCVEPIVTCSATTAGMNQTLIEQSCEIFLCLTMTHRPRTAREPVLPVSVCCDRPLQIAAPTRFHSVFSFAQLRSALIVSARRLLRVRSATCCREQSASKRSSAYSSQLCLRDECAPVRLTATLVICQQRDHLSLPHQNSAPVLKQLRSAA